MIKKQDATATVPDAERNRNSQQPAQTVDWATALAEHERWLRTVILARVGEMQAVDEVFQEVSLAAVAQKAPLENIDKVAPWLYRLAITQSLLYRRKMGRRRKLLDRYTQQTNPTAAEPLGDPLPWILADERRKMVRSALAQLPRRDAEILLLKYTENWSYRQLADHLGVSISAVEARLHRARQKMREQLTANEAVEVPQ